MEHIGDWLTKLGLSEYTERFVKNGIEIEVLAELTDEDLEKLGIVLGHRRKLLKAIRELGRVSSASLGTAPSSTKSDTLPRDAAERRQLTVMFCDLVGSTALSARMDPEDLREVIGAYHKCVAETVSRLDGFIAKYMGDGVLTYFGYPQAHEDDAERAVRAGLAVAEAVPKLVTHAGVPLQVRLGIATGLVVVGDLIGSGEAQERGIVGETPNLAARLQGIAEPNKVVIADTTRRLLGNLFELQDRGPKDLRGLAGSARVWVALRARSVESRFEALHTSGLTALVGREEEADLLFRRWSRAKTREGQVVLLSGEAGIGKSRLTAALMEGLSTELHTRLRYFCSPQHTDSTLYPIIGQMERAAGLTHDDTTKAKLDKLDALLAQSLTPNQEAALIAEMLSLPNDGRYPVLELEPQQGRQRTLAALLSQVEALTRQKPVLMIFEDVHWADPTTLEALGRMVDQIRTLRVMLIVTFRPEFIPPWVGAPHVSVLTINRLTERDVNALIDRVVGKEPLPASIRQDIIERTDGVPLFVEEMTKAVMEMESRSAAEQLAASVPKVAQAVPASLHPSLMARLDRVGSAKEIAQIGAAIGREFSHELLCAVIGKAEPEMLSALERLIAAGLLFRRGIPPHASYLFKHALVQDAAYSTLLREPRRAIHGRIADVLERQFPDIAESQPELLARHHTEAGAIEKAARLWGKAGQRSLARSALHEAAEQLTRALAQLGALPGTPSSRRQEIMLQVELRQALVHLKGYAAPETKAAVERTRLLIEQAEARGEPPEDPLLLFSLLNGLWTASIVAFDGDEARELAAEFLVRAERHNAAAPILDGYRIVGTSLLMTGEIGKGRAHFDRGISLCDRIDHSPLVGANIAADAKVVILGFRSIALWLLGYPKASLADAEHALSRAREITPVGTLMHTLSWTILVRTLCGDHITASRLVDELVLLADEKNTAFWNAWGMMNRGWLAALTGKARDAVQAITSGIGAWQSTGATMCVPFYSSCLARSYAKLGQFEDARRVIVEAMTVIEKTKERWFEAEIYRVAGEIELKFPNVDRARPEAYYERALSVARQQRAKSWELRAAMSIARLWRDQGQPQQAHDLLAPVYGWFTEGFETKDLKQAKALLLELL